MTARKIVLAVLGVLWLVPVYLLLANASKLPAEFGSYGLWEPGTLGGLWQNMLDAWDRGRLNNGVVSTAIYAIVAPAIAVVVGAAAGFAIVALRLRNGFFWLVVIFAASIFPLQMILMPLFVGYAQTGLFNTRIGMILVYTVIAVPFSAFVMSKYFTVVSLQVFDAVVNDACTTWLIILRLS